MLWRHNLHQPNVAYGISLVTVQVQRLDTFGWSYVQFLSKQTVHVRSKTLQWSNSKMTCNTPSCLANAQQIQQFEQLGQDRISNIWYRSLQDYDIQKRIDSFVHQQVTEPNNWQLTHSSCSRVWFQYVSMSIVPQPSFPSIIANLITSLSLILQWKATPYHRPQGHSVKLQAFQGSPSARIFVSTPGAIGLGFDAR